MKPLIAYLIIIASLLLTVVILLQNQGSSLGSGFGGETNFYRSKRGVEKVLYYATMVLAVLLVGGIIAALVIK